jgi:TonB family protein
MTPDPDIDRRDEPPDPEALDALFRGEFTIDDASGLVDSLMNSAPDQSDRIRQVLATAFREERLDADDFTRLTARVDEFYSEDLPTQWSEDVARDYALARENGKVVGNPARLKIRKEVFSVKPARRQGSGDFSAGTTLRDRFVLISQIDRGGMGEIYKALDRRKAEVNAADPWVAIKLIKRPLANLPAVLMALQKEAVNCQRLSHPNIIRVYDFDRDGDHFFMTMEKLDGLSLVDLLDQHPGQPLDERRVESVIRDIGSGLDYAHENGIVHADIKPGNIFITVAGPSKLLDFGIARASYGADCEDWPVAGTHTPEYSSCEILEGEKPTVQDDVYALACVAYRMLAGRRPWGTRTALEAEQRNLHPARIEGLDASRWMALETALAFRRRDRTENVRTFVDRFAPSNESAPRSAAESLDESAVQPPQQRLREPRWMFGVPAAVTVIFLAGIFFWMYRDEPGDIVATGSARSMTSETASMPGDSIGPPIQERTRIAPGLVGPPEELFGSGETQISTATVVKSDQSTRSSNVLISEQSGGVSGRAVPRLDLKESPPPESRLASIDDADSATNPLANADDRPTALAEEPPSDDEDSTMIEAVPVASLLAYAGGGGTATAAPDPGIFSQGNAALPAAPSEVGPPGDGLPVIPFVGEPNPATGTAHRDGETADVPTSVEELMEPVQVPLSDLEFQRYVEPEFPRRSGVGGWVVVRFRVTTTGDTADIEVVEAEPKRRFDDTALNAVAKWRFTPTVIAGETVERISVVRLRFEP